MHFAIPEEQIIVSNKEGKNCVLSWLIFHGCKKRKQLKTGNFTLLCNGKFKGVVRHFGKYIYYLSCQELDEKIEISLMSVCYIQYEATTRRCLA